MNNIPNDIVQEIILNKIKLFTKENYFRYFSNILLELSHNILAFQKKSSLAMSISSCPKEKIHNSWWQLITKLIFPIKDSYYEQNEDESENESDLNPLCFEYLKNLCHKKMKHLTSLSLTEQIPLKRIIPLYLNLCEKQIKINKEKQLGIYRRHDKDNNYTKLTKKSTNIFNKQNSFLNRTQIKINQKKIGGKNLPSIQQLDYSNSFTRLFIGETDEDSIRERYLSNMVVKKHKQLHLLNSYMDLSSMYLKRMYYKLFKKEGGKGVMDKDMINVINQFENDHKKVENFQRNVVSSDKGHQFDYTKNQLLLELQSQKQKYIKKPKKKKKIKNTFMTTSVSRNNEKVKMNQDVMNSNKNLLRKNRAKSQSNMINEDSKINNDIFLLNKKIVNSHGNNRYKNIKKSFSVLNSKNKIFDRKIYRSSSTISKRYNNYDYNRWNNATIFNENRKKYYLNYMNNNDFFFSQV
jgi:hypothetical protein